MDLPVLAQKTIENIPKSKGEWAPENPSRDISLTLYGRKYVKYLAITAGKLTFGRYIDCRVTNLEQAKFKGWCSINFQINAASISLSPTYEKSIEIHRIYDIPNPSGIDIRRIAFYRELFDEADIREQDVSMAAIETLLENLRLIKIMKTQDAMLSLLRKQDKENLLTAEITTLKQKLAICESQLASLNLDYEKAVQKIESMEDERDSFKEDLKYAAINAITHFKTSV